MPPKKPQKREDPPPPPAQQVTLAELARGLDPKEAIALLAARVESLEHQLADLRRELATLRTQTG